MISAIHKLPIIGRLAAWYQSLPSFVDDELDDKVIIPKKRYDGLPQNADECRRSYRFGDDELMLSMGNVRCTACGDPIHAHEITVDQQQ